jgi:hypothetical protein
LLNINPPNVRHGKDGFLPAALALLRTVIQTPKENFTETNCAKNCNPLLRKTKAFLLTPTISSSIYKKKKNAQKHSSKIIL